MIYEFNDRVTGDTERFDTANIEYDLLWGELGLSRKEQQGADKIIELYHSPPLRDEAILAHRERFSSGSFSNQSWSREDYRHQADHYHIRSKLEAIAQSRKVVRKLIHHEILELHPKWGRSIREIREIEGGSFFHQYFHHPEHPQAPYRLNVRRLYDLWRNQYFM